MTHQYKVGDRVWIKCDDYQSQPRGTMQVVTNFDGMLVACGSCCYYYSEVSPAPDVIKP